MLGLMQEMPLLVSGLAAHAARWHGDREIVSIEPDGTPHRTDWLTVEARARRLAGALQRLGIRAGDRVATLASNTHRHLECFYGVSGAGIVLHTVNPRLFPDQIIHIINHAGDRLLLFDADLEGLVTSIAPRLTSVEGYVALDGHPGGTGNIDRPFGYESLIDDAPPDYQWPSFDERTASTLCYTSGTTGDPKGVLFSNRAVVIHALTAVQRDCLALGSSDAVLPIAPLFHANGWTLPYSCALVGAKVVLPGVRLDPARLHRLIKAEQVTFAVGVPTIFTGLLAHLELHGGDLDPLSRILVGGSALPPTLQRTLRERYGVNAIHGWGMTETASLGTIATPTAAIEALPEQQQDDELAKQGRVPYPVDMRILAPDRTLAPRDGRTVGSLSVRGPCTTSGYFRRDGERILDEEGWFETGDVACWDEFGFMKITDRTKDVIKSGGEWISSIDLENLAMAHPGVRLAAAVAVHHAKWEERPILLVVPAGEAAPSREQILEFLRPQVVKWWMPDDVVFVSELPLTATGKIFKKLLRERYWLHLSTDPDDRC